MAAAVAAAVVAAQAAVVVVEVQAVAVPAGGSGSGSGAPATPLPPDVAVTSSVDKVAGVHVGDTLNVAFNVANKAGHGDGTNLHLLITLPANVQQVAPAYYEHGSGCVGAGTLDCSLDYLSGGHTTPVRLRLKVTKGTAVVIAARLTEAQQDADASDNVATLNIPVAAAVKPLPRLTVRTITARIVRGKTRTLRVQIRLSRAATVTVRFGVRSKSRSLARWTRHPRSGRTTLVLPLAKRINLPRTAVVALVAIHANQRATARIVAR